MCAKCTVFFLVGNNCIINAYVSCFFIFLQKQKSFSYIAFLTLKISSKIRRKISWNYSDQIHLLPLNSLHLYNSCVMQSKSKKKKESASLQNIFFRSLFFFAHFEVLDVCIGQYSVGIYKQYYLDICLLDWSVLLATVFWKWKAFLSHFSFFKVLFCGSANHLKLKKLKASQELSTAL